MKNIINKNIKLITAVVAILIILIMAAMVLSFSNERNNKQVSNISENNSSDVNSKAIVIYFSRTKGVYNGPLEVGNTKRVADFIIEATGADEFEILPLNDYPDDYEETTVVARRERENNERPEIKGELPDLSEYETIFIGSPIWWGANPMIIRTFLDKESEFLANKTLVPFTTHEGSGLGSSKSLLESEFPNARVLDGFSVRGNAAINSKDDVNKWLKYIGIID